MSALGLLDTLIPTAGIDQAALESTAESLCIAMMGAGVKHGILVADQRGPQSRQDSVRTEWKRVREITDRHRVVFSPAIGIDATSPGVAARSLMAAVSEGAVAAHAVPHAFGLAPDNRAWYPTYAACVDLEIPILIELGIRQSMGTRVRSVGRPICLDAVACDFPDLIAVAVGSWPWIEEAISMAYKHPGINLAVGGDDPGHDHPSLLRFATTWGSHKVVFASGGVDPAGAVARIRATGIGDEAITGFGQRGTDLFLGSRAEQIAERPSAIRNG